MAAVRFVGRPGRRCQTLLQEADSVGIERGIRSSPLPFPADGVGQPCGGPVAVPASAFHSAGAESGEDSSSVLFAFRAILPGVGETSIGNVSRG